MHYYYAALCYHAEWSVRCGRREHTIVCVCVCTSHMRCVKVTFTDNVPKATVHATFTVHVVVIVVVVLCCSTARSVCWQCRGIVRALLLDHILIALILKAPSHPIDASSYAASTLTHAHTHSRRCSSRAQMRQTASGGRLTQVCVQYGPMSDECAIYAKYL